MRLNLSRPPATRRDNVVTLNTCRSSRRETSGRFPTTPSAIRRDNAIDVAIRFSVPPPLATTPTLTASCDPARRCRRRRVRAVRRERLPTLRAVRARSCGTPEAPATGTEAGRLHTQHLTLRDEEATRLMQDVPE